MAGMSWKSSFPPKLCKFSTVDQTLEELRAAPSAALTPLAASGPGEASGAAAWQIYIPSPHTPPLMGNFLPKR